MNEKLRAFLMFPPAFALVGALVAAPHIVHALDQGSATPTVGQIARGEVGTRNVKLSALVLAERGVRLEVQEKNKAPRISFFMPVYDPGEVSGPTTLVVHSHYNEVFDAAEHPDEPVELEGTVRDVLWEGLDGDTKETLAAVHPLSPDVKLLELDRTQKSGDVLWGYGAPLAGLILGVLAVSGTSSKPKQPEAGA